jgi:hypothetical protein
MLGLAIQAPFSAWLVRQTSQRELWGLPLSPILHPLREKFNCISGMNFGEVPDTDGLVDF